jgi:hypothetical protein
MKKLINIFKKTKPSPDQALDGLKTLFEVIQENHRVTETETTKRAEISAIRDIEIEKIQAQKEVIKDYFEKTFSERDKSFDMMFKALDKGLETGNLEIVANSLHYIVDLAKTSPLKDGPTFAKALKDPNVKEIEI